MLAWTQILKLKHSKILLRRLKVLYEQILFFELHFEIIGLIIQAFPIFAEAEADIEADAEEEAKKDEGAEAEEESETKAEEEAEADAMADEEAEA
jgi:hypothetical protein